MLERQRLIDIPWHAETEALRAEQPQLARYPHFTEMEAVVSAFVASLATATRAMVAPDRLVTTQPMNTPLPSDSVTATGNCVTCEQTAQHYRRPDQSDTTLRLELQADEATVVEYGDRGQQASL